MEKRCLESQKRKLKHMIPIDDILKADIEYTDEVIRLYKKATKYLKSYTWCEKILNCWLAKGFGYILCIFSFEIKPIQNSGADDKLWVIVGDLPSAYLDQVEYKTANEALDFYCFLMDEWVEHVRKGKSLKDCYPVNVAPTKEYADMLDTRTKLIRENFLPFV